MLGQFAEVKSGALEDLADSRAALAASNTEILALKSLALAVDIALANVEFNQVRQQLQGLFSNLGEAAEADLAALERQIDHIAGQRAAAFAAAQQSRTGSLQQFVVADAATAVAIDAARAASQAERAFRDETWETSKRTPQPPPPPPSILADPPASRGKVVGDLLRDSAAERANFQHFDDTEQRIALGQDAQEMFLDMTPFGVAKDLFGASTGYDVLREREMTLGERIWCGIAGGLGTAGALFGMFDDIAETVGHYAKRFKDALRPLDDVADTALELSRASSTRQAKDILVLGRGTPEHVADVAKVVHGRVINNPALTDDPRALWRHIYGEMRRADEIVQVLDTIPTKQVGGRGTGEWARAEKMFVETMDELMEKTTQVRRADLGLE